MAPPPSVATPTPSATADLEPATSGRWAAAVCTLLLATAAQAEERVTVPTRQGVTEMVVLTTVPQPVASVLLLPGGNGAVAVVRNNFLLRVVPQFAAAGINVGVLDVPSDQAGGLPPVFRAGAAHAQDIAAAVALLKLRADRPVWLVGTSNGSVSAANGAAVLGAKVRGAVLTSSVWASRMGLVPLEAIRVPVLVVHNRDDGCQESPFAGTDYAMKRLAAAPMHELLAVSGGQARGEACGAMSRHGYLGIEDQVVPPIIAWMKAH